MILTAHVVLIGGMLLQGCKDTSEQPNTGNSTNSTNTAYAADTNSNPETTPPVRSASLSNEQAAASQPAAQQSPAPEPELPPSSPPPVAPAIPPAPAAPSSDYVVARGDTLGAIAKRQHVSLNSLMEANPGLNAKKLKIGQKLQIPGATGAVSATADVVPTAQTATADVSVYVVKSGDTLSKIARLHGVSSKKLIAFEQS
jgi:LysM repeat protein